MLHTSALISDKWPNTWKRERLEVVVPAGIFFGWLGGESSNRFPNKELCSTKIMVHIVEEGPKEDLFDLDRPSIESYIDSSVVPP